MLFAHDFFSKKNAYQVELCHPTPLSCSFPQVEVLQCHCDAVGEAKLMLFFRPLCQWRMEQGQWGYRLMYGWCMFEGLWCFMASYIFEDVYFISGCEDVYYIYVCICCPFQKCRVLQLHKGAGVKLPWSWGVSRFSRASIGTNAFSRHFAGHFNDHAAAAMMLTATRGYNNGNARFVHVEPFRGGKENLTVFLLVKLETILTILKLIETAPAHETAELREFFWTSKNPMKAGVDLCCLFICCWELRLRICSYVCSNSFPFDYPCSSLSFFSRKISSPKIDWFRCPEPADRLNIVLFLLKHLLLGVAVCFEDVINVIFF